MNDLFSQTPLLPPFLISQICPFLLACREFQVLRSEFQDGNLNVEDENLAPQSLRRKLSSQGSSDQTSWWTSKNAWQVSPSLASVPSAPTPAKSKQLVTLLNQGLDPALPESKSEVPQRATQDCLTVGGKSFCCSCPVFQLSVLFLPGSGVQWEAKGYGR